MPAAAKKRPAPSKVEGSVLIPVDEIPAPAHAGRAGRWKQVLQELIDRGRPGAKVRIDVQLTVSQARTALLCLKTHIKKGKMPISASLRRLDGEPTLYLEHLK